MRSLNWNIFVAIILSNLFFGQIYFVSCHDLLHVECEQPILTATEKDVVQQNVNTAINDLFRRYAERGNKIGVAYMHPTPMATFDHNCNQLKANVDRNVGEALSSGRTCDLLAAHLQEKLNEFETSLQCELSSIFIEFSFTGNVPAIAHVIRNHQRFTRSTDVDVNAIQAESILKVSQLFDCSHRFLGKKYDNAENWEYRKTVLAGEIKLVKFRLPTELYADITQIFGQHLTGLREQYTGGCLQYQHAIDEIINSSTGPYRLAKARIEKQFDPAKALAPNSYQPTLESPSPANQAFQTQVNEHLTPIVDELQSMINPWLTILSQFQLNGQPQSQFYYKCIELYNQQPMPAAMTAAAELQMRDIFQHTTAYVRLAKLHYTEFDESKIDEYELHYSEQFKSQLHHLHQNDVEKLHEVDAFYDRMCKYFIKRYYQKVKPHTKPDDQRKRINYDHLNSFVMELNIYGLKAFAETRTKANGE